MNSSFRPGTVVLLELQSKEFCFLNYFDAVKWNFNYKQNLNIKLFSKHLLGSQILKVLCCPRIQLGKMIWEPHKVLSCQFPWEIELCFAVDNWPNPRFKNKLEDCSPGNLKIVQYGLHFTWWIGFECFLFDSWSRCRWLCIHLVGQRCSCDC